MNNRIIPKFSKLQIKKYLLIVLILAIVGFVLGFALVKNESMLTHANQMVMNHIWLFRIFRWAMILVLLFSWPFLVEWIGNKTVKKDTHQYYLKREVVRIGIWLILFELLINQNIIFKLFHAAAG